MKQLAGIFESDSPRGRLGEAPRDRRRRCSARSTPTTVAGHLGDPDRPRAGADGRRPRDAVLLGALLHRGGRGGAPTMLVFEDLHWADPSLLDLVELLGARLRELPVLLLVLARPELLDARPAGAAACRRTRRSRSGRWARTRRRLATSCSARSRSRAAAALAQTAEGNPLFIEQLAAALSERPTCAATRCRRRSGASSPRAWTRSHARSGRCSSMPPSVGKVFWRGALDRRRRRALGPPGRTRAARPDPAETVSAIEGDQQYTFTHVLIRDAAYDMLPRAQRRERHRRWRSSSSSDRRGRRSWSPARAPLARGGRSPRAVE